MNYSGKNIPLPTKNEYLKCLLEKIESVIKRMRWRAHFFLNKNTESDTSDSDTDNEDKDENYGFKSKRTPPIIAELADFEKDMLHMVDNRQYRQVNNDFQNNLSKDVKQINSSE